MSCWPSSQQLNLELDGSGPWQQLHLSMNSGRKGGSQLTWFQKSKLQGADHLESTSQPSVNPYYLFFGSVLTDRTRQVSPGLILNTVNHTIQTNHHTKLEFQIKKNTKKVNTSTKVYPNLFRTVKLDEIKADDTITWKWSPDIFIHRCVSLTMIVGQLYTSFHLSENCHN